MKSIVGHLARDISLYVHSKRNPSRPKVLANSMPKAGTNLLERLMSLLPGMKRGAHLDMGPDQAILDFDRPQQLIAEKFINKIASGIYATSHCFYFSGLANLLDQKGIKCVTIVRDPRDVCVSDYHYIMKSEGHRLHRFYKQMGSNSERLMASIVGMPSEALDGAPPSLDIGQHYKNFMGWSSYSHGLVLRFEDLVGSKGGGSDKSQRESLEKVVSFLGIELDEKELEEIRGNLFFTKSPTFRKGQIGSWKEEFNDDHRQAFKKVAGEILISFGYEF